MDLAVYSIFGILFLSFYVSEKGSSEGIFLVEALDYRFQVLDSQTVTPTKTGALKIPVSAGVTGDKGSFVASSRGKYYYPVSCSKARGLSEKNKLFFDTKEEAEAKGFKAHSDC